MDHIKCDCVDPWPGEVPYLFDPKYPYVYDNETWARFPERMGWTIKELQAIQVGKPSSNPEHTNERAASLAQAWLYFGLIHVLTETPVDTQKYLRLNSNGKQIISTAYFPEQVEQWRQSLARKSKEQLTEYCTSLDRLIDVIDSQCFRVAQGNETVVPCEVFFSIVVLRTSLISCKTRWFPNSSLPPEPQLGHAHDRIREQLTRKCWCQSEVQRMGQIFCSLTMYHVGASGRKKSTRDHSNCHRDQCKALQQADTKDYRPRHAIENCQCPLVGPNQEQIMELIRKGEVPLVSYSDTQGLQIGSFRQGESHQHPYIAISHVWADGLGNPNANAMHQCQFVLMQKRVRMVAEQLHGLDAHLQSSMYFWIDTICVPAENVPEKGMAIASMETIYKEAAAVLVIDSELELIHESSSPAYIAAMIGSSIWLTRLWTIQEAAFAKQLYFQLSSRAITETELRQVVVEAGFGMDGEKPLRWNSDACIITDALTRLLELRLDRMRMCHGIGTLRGMQFRFTTRAADEAVCLAILLGFRKDWIQILHRLPEDADLRMKLFLMMQKYVPREMLFWEGRNLSGHGFAWAPSTFLSRRGGVPHGLPDPSREYRKALTMRDVRSPNETYVDSNGFHVRFPGIFLELTDYTKEKAKDIQMHVENLDSRHCSWLVANSEFPEPTWDHFAGLTGPTIILPREVTVSRPIDQTNMIIGALVDVTGSIESGSEELCCIYKTLVICFGLDWDWKPTAGFLQEARGRLVRAVGFKEQMWCVK